MHPSRDGRPRAADWAVAVVAVLLHLAPVRVGQADVGLDGPLLAALSPVLALGTGLPLAWRRGHPRPVAGCVLASYASLAAIEGLVPAWSAWVLIWSLATSGADRRTALRLSAAAASTTVAILAMTALLTHESGGLALLIGVTAVVALAALLLRTERGRVAEAGRRAAIEERLRIARDLHDLVGHGLSAVAVQSSTARLALQAGETGTAQRALAAVESSSRTAISEMRQLLDVLADAEGAPEHRPPSPGVRDVAALVENVRAAGVAVAMERTGNWDDAAPSVQLCAYRVVQEGLTNAIKHSPDAAVAVRLAASDDTGLVRVQSLGAVAPENAEGQGRGLDGLRTRVAALSGEFRSGPTPQGWLIEARFPLAGAARRRVGGFSMGMRHVVIIAHGRLVAHQPMAELLGQAEGSSLEEVYLSLTAAGAAGPATQKELS